MKQLKWAVLGTGVIANEMAQALIKKGKSMVKLIIFIITIILTTKGGTGK